jgi:hypothetical protein
MWTKLRTYFQKSFFNWTPQDAAAWERLRRHGPWRFILWYGAGLLGGGLFLLGSLVIALTWLQASPAGLAFVALVLGAVAVICVAFGALAAWATWAMEEAVYQRYLKRQPRG